MRQRAVAGSGSVQQPSPVDSASPAPLARTATADATIRSRLSFFALSCLSRAFAALFPSVQYVALPSDSLTLRSTAERPASIHLYGEEFDIGAFAARHPGGSLVLQQLLGQDCTDVFAVHHPPRLVQQAKDIADGQPAKGMLGPLHKGKSRLFPAAAERSAMQRDFDAIVQQLEAEGKFAPTPYYYITKAVTLALVLAAAVSLILIANEHTEQLATSATTAKPMQTAMYSNATAVYTTASLASSAPTVPTSILSSLLWAVTPSYSLLLYTLSALTIGMFWQQLAFLGHDAGHNQLTGSTRTDYVYAWLVTAFFGVSGSWWKRSHNVHHVHTNSIECDPDIQHLPMLAVSGDILKGFYSTYHQKTFTFDRVAQAFVRYQHFLYYPLMSIARANLYVQSFLLVLNPNVKVPHRRAELVALLVYWCWFIALMRLLPASSLLRFWYYMLSHAVVGLIHVQITLSHFAMPAYHGLHYARHAARVVHHAARPAPAHPPARRRCRGRHHPQRGAQRRRPLLPHSVHHHHERGLQSLDGLAARRAAVPGRAPSAATTAPQASPLRHATLHQTVRSQAQTSLPLLLVRGRQQARLPAAQAAGHCHGQARAAREDRQRRREHAVARRHGAGVRSEEGKQA